MKKVVSIFLAVQLIMVCLFTVSVNACSPSAQHGKYGYFSKYKIQYPITVKDASGAEVTISKKPQKIVSVTLATDEILLSLVDKSRIKALTYMSVDPNLSNVVDAASDIPEKVEGKAEKIIPLEPDLVFVGDWHSKEFIQQLKDANLNVYVTKTPSTINEVKNNICKISYILGEIKKGIDVIQWMDNKLRAIERKVKKIDTDERLTVLNYNSFETTSGIGSSFEEIVTRAGLINLPSKEGMEGWPPITREQIAELNPDVIILPSIAYDPSQDPQVFAQGVRQDPVLANVSAVMNKKVIILPEPHMSSVSQYMVLGIEDAAKAAYPNLFTK